VFASLPPDKGNFDWNCRKSRRATSPDFARLHDLHEGRQLN
jgi:hypothetical protein